MALATMWFAAQATVNILVYGKKPRVYYAGAIPRHYFGAHHVADRLESELRFGITPPGLLNEILYECRIAGCHLGSDY